jgi:hypothetical protein
LRWQRHHSGAELEANLSTKVDLSDWRVAIEVQRNLTDIGEAIRRREAELVALQIISPGCSDARLAATQPTYSHSVVESVDHRIRLNAKAGLVHGNSPGTAARSRLNVASQQQFDIDDR